ncbi:MAG: hypothetical protein H6713_31930 [Myxococcales bacterium]|nr:hypothetical protein [Myxococcales bacterium]MCB9754570.1 hypothetical protein [Myxococcales bacterium]
MRASRPFSRSVELPAIGVEPPRLDRTLGRAGLLAALAPLVWPALQRVYAATGPLGELVSPWLAPLSLVITALLLGAGLTLARAPRWGRAMLVTGGLGFATVATLGLERAPAPAMMLLIFVVVFGAWIYFSPEAAEPGHTLPNSRLARARMAALGSMCAVLVAVGFRLTQSPWPLAPLLLSQVITLGLCARGVVSLRPRDDAVVGITAAVTVGGALALRQLPELAAFALLATPAVLVFALGRRMERDPLRREGLGDLLFHEPARLLVASFLIAGLAGAVTLTLPSTSAGDAVSLLDAAFTAFSAVCVTGLAVLDTGRDFSRAGQGVIMLLIQLGGLGIMTFSTIAMVLLGQRLTIRQESAVAELIGSDRRASLVSALRRVFVITAICEAAGAVTLAALFRAHGDAWGMALWRGLFTSVSAYCNAGFALQSDSLVAYQNSPLILHCVGALVILGGLGPAVVAALPLALRRRPLDLYVRVALLSAVVLLVVPATLLAALEWNHSLAELSVPARLHNAWFQSLTTRTAGFNSVDFAAMTPASQTLVEALMFIGGSPGSTAGGIKTTTAFVMLLSILAVARGDVAVEWGGWTISRSTVSRAAAVTSLGAASVVLGVFTILLTQELDTGVALFEVVSALGTVGLSIGGTARLDGVGELIIIACMFAGRVAPLTLLLFFSRAGSRRGGWSFPERDISVG